MGDPIKDYKITPKELAAAKDFLARKAKNWKTTPLLLIVGCRRMKMGFRELYDHTVQVKLKMLEEVENDQAVEEDRVRQGLSNEDAGRD